MNSIWIRSQLKHQLVVAKIFSIFKGAEMIRLQFSIKASGDQREVSAIAALDSYGCVYLAGIYPTEERALQVLDEIQRFIRNYEHFRVTGGGDNFNNTFEMPAE